ncbi:MAG: tRNA pseudouridine(13) synthase TruD [Desulfurococcales archaeon]|nr:tRNA pseudouridine(13) synthase TruD [Desulfurococcales archaeon]
MKKVMEDKWVGCIASSSTLDLLLGMDCYMTSGEPLIPSRSLDHHNFYVYEFTKEMGVLRPPIKPYQEDGNMLVYLLIKRGIDTYKAVKILKMYLKPKKISYYGLKDARASTYQLVTVEEPKQVVTYILEKNLEAILLGRSSRHARIGNIVGNCFKIHLREIIGDHVGDELYKILGRISEYGYIPNYYSYQRFGVSRPITHIAGLGMLCRQYERALYAIVVGEPPKDLYIEEIKAMVTETCMKIVESGPRWMEIEKRVCAKYLDSGDAAKALRKGVERRIADLYVSAAYSYIFNLYLSHRWKRYGLGFEPVEGEIALRSSIYGIRVPGKMISKRDMEEGYGGIYISSMKALGLESCEPELGSHIRRALILPIKIELLDPDNGVIWFCLDPGGYATNLLREIFKIHSPRLFTLDLHIGADYK